VTIKGPNLIVCDETGCGAMLSAGDPKNTPGPFSEPEAEVMRLYALAYDWTTDRDGADRCPRHPDRDLVGARRAGPKLSTGR
jgi:hypothetical protein